MFWPLMVWGLIALFRQALGPRRAGDPGPRGGLLRRDVADRHAGLRQHPRLRGHRHSRRWPARRRGARDAVAAGQALREAADARPGRARQCRGARPDRHRADADPDRRVLDVPLPRRDPPPVAGHRPAHRGVDPPGQPRRQGDRRAAAAVDRRAVLRHLPLAPTGDRLPARVGPRGLTVAIGAALRDHRRARRAELVPRRGPDPSARPARRPASRPGAPRLGRPADPLREPRPRHAAARQRPGPGPAWPRPGSPRSPSWARRPAARRRRPPPVVRRPAVPATHRPTPHPRRRRAPPRRPRLRRRRPRRRPPRSTRPR